jgi:transposase, IS5 family
MKADGLLGRNFLLGTEGDAANAVFAAAGHNMRLLRAWLAWLLAFLLGLLAAPQPSHATASPRPAAV